MLPDEPDEDDEPPDDVLPDELPEDVPEDELFDEDEPDEELLCEEPVPDEDDFEDDELCELFCDEELLCEELPEEVPVCGCVVFFSGAAVAVLPDDVLPDAPLIAASFSASCAPVGSSTVILDAS